MIQKLFKSFAGMSRRQDGAITVEMALTSPVIFVDRGRSLGFWPCLVYEAGNYKCETKKGPDMG